MTEIPNPEENPTADQSTSTPEGNADGSTPPADAPAPPADPTASTNPPPPYPGQIPVAPVKRLYRDPNGAIGGVMSGLAHYFNVDVTLARLAMVVLVMFTGTGILAYIVAWIVVPEAPHPLHFEQPVQPPTYAAPTSSTTTGVGV